ncbi:MAG: hypothetical protein BWX45_00990 [Deltaproteobacteria bacterium ADurb.Bin002]|nr:MAG: hypothetical protein BWX45_00990 [Deltaproteobacteria bacterium ADurb.Bin002]
MIHGFRNDNAQHRKNGIDHGHSIFQYPLDAGAKIFVTFMEKNFFESVHDQKLRNDISQMHQNAAQNVFLCFKVAENGSFRDTGLARDFARTGRTEAFFRDDANGRIEDLFFFFRHF